MRLFPIKACKKHWKGEGEGKTGVPDNHNKLKSPSTLIRQQNEASFFENDDVFPCSTGDLISVFNFLPRSFGGKVKTSFSNFPDLLWTELQWWNIYKSIFLFLVHFFP